MNPNDPYPKSSFDRQFLGDEAVKYWNIKKILCDFYYGAVCGYIKNIHPRPTFSMSQEIVEKLIAKIDKEWTQEYNSRGKPEYSGPPDFQRLLSPTQKMAFIEAILQYDPTWPQRLAQSEATPPSGYSSGWIED